MIVKYTVVWIPAKVVIYAIYAKLNFSIFPIFISPAETFEPNRIMIFFLQIFFSYDSFFFFQSYALSHRKQHIKQCIHRTNLASKYKLMFLFVI